MDRTPGAESFVISQAERTLSGDESWIRSITGRAISIADVTSNPITDAVVRDQINQLKYRLSDDLRPDFVCGWGYNCDYGSDDPNLFWAIHKTVGVDVIVRDVRITAAKVSIDVSYHIHDDYGFGLEHVSDPDLSFWARTANAGMRYLQVNCGSARAYRVAVEVDDTLEVPLSASCELVTAGDYRLRVWNSLPQSIDLDFIEVVIPGVPGSRPVPFSALLDPGVCEIYGLPVVGTYSMDLYVHPSGLKRNLRAIFQDSGPGFIVDARRVYAIRVARGTCNAELDSQMQFEGQPLYSVCLP